MVDSDKNAKPKLYVRVVPMQHPNKSSNPDLDCLAYVNDDSHPILINNEHFTGNLVFRVRNFHGWTPLSEKTGKPLPHIGDCPKYFEGHKRTFSLQLSGRFRRKWTGDDIMFGTFFHEKLELPRGSGLALAFARRIDPSMEYEMSDDPYICSPILCAMNTVHIQPLLAPDPNRTSPRTSVFDDRRMSIRRSLYETAVLSHEDNARGVRVPLTLPEWRWNTLPMEENLMAAWPNWTLVSNNSSFKSSASMSGDDGPETSSALSKAVSKNKVSAAHRRQWFLDERHRKRFLFHPDTVYSFDFASPYVDMNEITLKMGISIPVCKYLGGQPVRYECRTRDGKTLFWAVELGMV